MGTETQRRKGQGVEAEPLRKNPTEVASGVEVAVTREAALTGNDLTEAAPERTTEVLTKMCPHEVIDRRIAMLLWIGDRTLARMEEVGALTVMAQSTATTEDEANHRSIRR